MLLVVLIVTSLIGCLDFDETVAREFEEEYGADENTVLEVKNTNGNVRVMAAEGMKVELHVEMIAKEKYEDELTTIVGPSSSGPVE